MDLASKTAGFEYKWKTFLIFEPLEPQRPLSLERTAPRIFFCNYGQGFVIINASD